MARMTFEEALRAFNRGTIAPIVLDIETTIVEGSPDPKDGAEGVLYGMKVGSVCKTFRSAHDLLWTLLAVLNANQGSLHVLVGHNVKFDLKHLMHDPAISIKLNLVLEHENLVGVWDTGVFEYLHSGQVHKYPKLSDCLRKRHIEEEKLDDVTALFSSGKGADHVTPERLEEYLVQDLKVTELLFKKQLCECSKHPRLLNHMFVQGWALVAYTRMEDVGIPLLASHLEELDRVTGNTRDRLEGLLKRWVYARLDGKVPMEELGVTNRALSTCFFGVPGVPYKSKFLIGKYKNGKPKFISTSGRAAPTEGLVPTTVFDPDVKPSETLGWPLHEEALGKLADSLGPEHEITKVIALIQAWRKAAKINGTYTGPFLARVRHTGESRAYHSINNVVTNTGRTSSSGPNAQNLPDLVRACVGAAGFEVFQMDFSQLELCGAAELSGDLSLLYDVKHSDVHYETGKDVMGWKDPADMDKHSRRVVKGVNFGIIYGGGEKTISKETGVPVELVKKQIAAFKRRYPVFTEWQKNLKKTVAGLRGTDPAFKAGESYYLRRWVSATGRIYMFPDSKRKWDGAIGPNPSAIVNYPVQGYATGDVVPLFIAYIHGYNRMQYGFPFVAVHDSVVGLVLPTNREKIEREIKLAEEELPNLIAAAYGLVPAAPYKLDLEIKPTWT